MITLTLNIKQILSPLDGSENSLRSLKYSLDLAKQCQAVVIGLHVFTDMSLFEAIHPTIISESKWPNYIKDIYKDARKIAEKYNGIKFEEIVIGGRDASYDIVSFANSRSNNIDIIVMGKRGLGFPKEVFAGSTTNYVINRSRVPVLVVK